MVSILATKEELTSLMKTLIVIKLIPTSVLDYWQSIDTGTMSITTTRIRILLPKIGIK